MAKTYKLHDRAPHTPHRCIVCKVVPSAENQVVDLDIQIDFYGMVYLCYRCTVGITSQLGFTTPEMTASLTAEVTSLREKVNRIPAVTERLVNDIRDLSISATAELLAEPTPVILVDDKKPEQVDSGVNSDYFGDDSTLESRSEPVVDKGSDSVSTNPGSKRSTKAASGASTTSN